MIISNFACYPVVVISSYHLAENGKGNRSKKKKKTAKICKLTVNRRRGQILERIKRRKKVTSHAAKTIPSSHCLSGPPKMSWQLSFLA